MTFSFQGKPNMLAKLQEACNLAINTAVPIDVPSDAKNDPVRLSPYRVLCDGGLLFRRFVVFVHLVEGKCADHLSAVKLDVNPAIFVHPGDADLLVARVLAVTVTDLGNVGGQLAFAVFVSSFFIACILEMFHVGIVWRI